MTKFVVTVVVNEGEDLDVDTMICSDAYEVDEMVMSWLSDSQYQSLGVNSPEWWAESGDGDTVKFTSDSSDDDNDNEGWRVAVTCTRV